MSQNIRQRKAIEYKNRQRLLAANPNLDNKSGIYFLTRENEDGVKFAYIGQAVHLMQRLCSHLVGYQHIDLSLKNHGLYSANNIYGWKIGFMHFPQSQLNEKERHYITMYAKNGYQMRNKDTGGGAGKQEIGERKPSKGYRDGLKQGAKNLAKELSSIIEKHLTVTLKPEKQNNKVSIKALEKFNDLIDERSYEDE